MPQELMQVYYAVVIRQIHLNIFHIYIVYPMVPYWLIAKETFTDCQNNTFYRTDALSDAQTTSSKYLMYIIEIYMDKSETAN